MERSNQELENFAYVASHDLRSPLRGIDNLATWIEEDVGDQLGEEATKHLVLMRQRVNRMEALLDSILKYSRVGRKEEMESQVDMNELLDDVVFLLEKPAEFIVSVSSGLPTIVAPRPALERVFANLIDNAIKHHDRPDGRVEIGYRLGSGRHEFTIKDDGPGIPLAFHDRVFGMFQTLKSRDSVEGSGMGLAMVKKTVEVFGGAISLQSSPGEGAEFTVFWPSHGNPTRYDEKSNQENQSAVL